MGNTVWDKMLNDWKHGRTRMSDDQKLDAVQRSKNHQIAEQARVARILDRDRQTNKRERNRITALHEYGQGNYANLDKIAIPPPPEQRRRGDYVPYRGEKIGKTARAPMTVKNLSVDRAAQLLRRGVIDRDIYKALARYRAAWELSGLSPQITAAYDERNTGERSYGHMPKTERQVLFRAEYRSMRDSIPADVIDLFEAIVLHDHTLAEEGQASSQVGSGITKYRNTKAAFLRACLILFDTVKGSLKIDD
jgi:hypothetical protein